jgi:hypothetical protein
MAEKVSGSSLAQIVTQTRDSRSVSCKQSGLSHIETGQQDNDIFTDGA